MLLILELSIVFFFFLFFFSGFISKHLTIFLVLLSDTKSIFLTYEMALSDISLIGILTAISLFNNVIALVLI